MRVRKTGADHVIAMTSRRKVDEVPLGEQEVSKQTGLGYSSLLSRCLGTARNGGGAAPEVFSSAIFCRRDEVRTQDQVRTLFAVCWRLRKTKRTQRIEWRFQLYSVDHTKSHCSKLGGAVPCSQPPNTALLRPEASLDRRPGSFCGHMLARLHSFSTMKPSTKSAISPGRSSNMSEHCAKIKQISKQSSTKSTTKEEAKNEKRGAGERHTDRERERVRNVHEPARRKWRSSAFRHNSAQRHHERLFRRRCQPHRSTPAATHTGRPRSLRATEKKRRKGLKKRTPKEGKRARRRTCFCGLDNVFIIILLAKSHKSKPSIERKRKSRENVSKR